MAPGNQAKKRVNKGAWTAEEDKRLSQYIELLGPKRWKTIAVKAGLNRCGKSCRLRWLNYLRPNIKRGDISDAEEDLILRLHKLLGNRWSLIAGRLPGRTDNEIKNYWNSHLSKKLNYHKVKRVEINPTPPLENISPSLPPKLPQAFDSASQMEGNPSKGETSSSLDLDNIFDFSMEGGAYELEWVSKFLDHEHDHDPDWIAY